MVIYTLQKEQSMEMSPMRRAGAIPSVVVAANMLAGCSVDFTPDRDSVPVEGVASPAPRQCWEVDNPRPAEGLAQDLTDLPPLAERPSNSPMAARSVKVGEIIDGKLQTAPNSNLTPTHEAALNSLANVPYINCVMERHVQRVDVRATNEHGDNGFYYGGTPAQNGDRIEFVFTEKPEREAHMFKTKGSIVALAAHEGTHAIYDEWNAVRASKPHNEELLGTLDKYYVDELHLAAESFRKWRGKDAVKDLRELRKHFNSRNAHDASAATDTLIDAFKEPRGLDQLVAKNCEERCERNSIQDMLTNVSVASGEQETDPKLKLPESGLLNGLNAKYSKHLESHFIGSDESFVLYEQMRRAGHPYDSANELVASTIASDLTDPEAAATSIRLLSEEQRRIVIAQRETIVKLFENNNPELVPFINTPIVLKNVK